MTVRGELADLLVAPGDTFLLGVTQSQTLISPGRVEVASGVAFATAAFAGDVTMAKTKADCDKAGGAWDATTNTCKSKM
jgi:hypothetical protein